MTKELDEVRHLLTADDVAGAVRILRAIAETADLHEIAAVTRELAAHTEFDDLAQAATAVIAAPGNGDALTVFGFECIERGLSFAAVPVLRAALRAGTSKKTLALNELVCALEDEFRHGEAAAVLLDHEAELRPWPERYLLIYNSILAGDLDRARSELDRLPDPEDERWLYAQDRVRRMVARADAAATVSALDHRDLRGWHFTLTGGYLATLSPFGFGAGMTGRWAYLGDNEQLCRSVLDRLAVILDATGRAPTSVSYLPERGDRIVAAAVARRLGLPTEPYRPEQTGTLVVVYDLNVGDPETIVSLRNRTDDQILFEYATCWTRTPVVAADISGLLCQFVVPPWEGRIRIGEDTPPTDPRTDEQIVDDILAADGTPDPGDGQTPADTDQAVAAFVTATRDNWLSGLRTAMNSPGPVRSTSFG